MSNLTVLDIEIDLQLYLQFFVCAFCVIATYKVKSYPLLQIDILTVICSASMTVPCTLPFAKCKI